MKCYKRHCIWYKYLSGHKTVYCYELFTIVYYMIFQLNIFRSLRLTTYWDSFGILDALTTGVGGQFYYLARVAIVML